MTITKIIMKQVNADWTDEWTVELVGSGLPTMHFYGEQEARYYAEKVAERTGIEVTEN